jgi:hypothetical protein
MRLCEHGGMDDQGGRTMRADRVRVVALNPWARFGAWEDRRAVLADGLRALRPDLVALVEVVKTDDYDQAAISAY